MKKIISVLIILSLAFSVLTVSAQDEEIYYDYMHIGYGSCADDDCATELIQLPSMMLSDYAEGSIYERIYNGILNLDEYIDIREYGVPYDESVLLALFDRVRYDHPELFYLTDRIRYAYDAVNILGIAPEYVYSKEDVAVKTNELQHMVEDVLSDCPDGTDLEKVLYIHDCLVSNSEYDFTLSKRDTYTFLKYGTGVCEGYSQTFQLFMNELGIESYQVSSYAINHIWNVVNIDGEFYHLDATWDDPADSNNIEYLGMAWHNYFLISEEKLLALSPKRADMVFVNSEYIKCNSHKYESDYAWVDDMYPVIKYENGWISLTQGVNSIYDIHFYNNGLKDEEFKISVPDSFFAPGEFYPLSGMFRIGRNIYGNTNAALWCLEHTDSGYEFKSITIPGMDIAAGERIYGSRYDHNGHIVVTYGTARNESTIHYIDTPCLTNENFSWANAMVDIRRIILNVNKKDINELLMDINGDHSIDIRDLIGIKERAVA